MQVCDGKSAWLQFPDKVVDATRFIAEFERGIAMFGGGWGAYQRVLDGKLAGRFIGEEEIDGPVFEVSDRRGSITADRTGVRFTLDGEEAEFGWDEIGAVEVDAARFGRRFTVTVYMTTRRWYSAEVTAPAKSHLREWAAELDVALDAYFEQTEL